MLSLRAATPADAPMLRRWDREPHVVASKGDGDWQWETELPRRVPWRALLIAELDGTPIGFVQIIDPAAEDSRYWGDCPQGRRAIDIWIGEPAHLAQGWGTRMMQAAIARCFADPAVTAILIDPLETNHRARRFYERLGFCAVGPRHFGEDACMVYQLDRPAQDPRA